ncbi:hypothetical protein, partial [Mobiluncus mulieris]|uniref:hypothetical protein n=1 Tax=Mobiluncus mulieris TaxID=2052 RepID=UPI002093EC53
GLRIGEALALTWSDIEWSRRIIQVRHAFTEVSGRLVLAHRRTAKPAPCLSPVLGRGWVTALI